MDVLKISLMLGLAASLSACADKTASSVFPENSSLSASCNEQAIKTEFLVSWEDGTISLEKDTDGDAFSKNFIEPRLADIRGVEFNKKLRLHQSYSTQVSGSLTTWGQDLVEASAAWNQGVNGQGVLVAVTDTVIDLNHTQLAPNIFVNTAELNGSSGVDDDGNGFVDDIHGWDFLKNRPHQLGSSADAHGSHVAGIIAADHAHGPIRGLAPAARILPAAFLSETGEGDLLGAISSLKYAALMGAKVVNASWGGSECSQALRSQMSALSDAGILMVVAAGNDGKDLDVSPDYPASYVLPTQITVAAMKYTGYMSRFSNTSYSFVNIAAPGEDIYSTVPWNSVGSMSGTSMAAPFVSGAAALLWSAYPNASAAQIKRALYQSVDTGNYRVQTQGRLNVRKALTAIKQIMTQ